jgi:hypothetical protein
MDALITTIVAGVVVAVIGAFAAYYFGGRQEHYKQVYAKRRDEEKQPEAKQNELRKRRTEALAEIRSRAYSVVEDLKGLVERIASLHARLPGRYTRQRSWKAYVDEYARLAQQRDNIVKEMESLRAYYE